jgi:hypothetical protein
MDSVFRCTRNTQSAPGPSPHSTEKYRPESGKEPYFRIPQKSAPPGAFRVGRSVPRACARGWVLSGPKKGRFLIHWGERGEGRMTKSSLFVLLLSTANYSHGVELTTCRAPAGKSYFHYSGLLDKKSAGWADDKMSNGVFTLTQTENGAFDVVYVDVRGKPISSSQDGALVRLLRKGSNSLSVLVFYPSSSTEIYTFFTEKDGAHKFTLLQSRNGDAAAVPKSTLLVGSCEPIQLDQVR